MNSAEMISSRVDELLEVLESNYGNGLKLEEALMVLIQGLYNGFCVYEITTVEDLDKQWQKDYDALVRTLHKMSDAGRSLIVENRNLTLRLEASEAKKKAPSKKKPAKKRRGKVVPIDKKKQEDDNLPF
jgi:hypothetical protein